MPPLLVKTVRNHPGCAATVTWVIVVFMVGTPDHSYTYTGRALVLTVTLGRRRNCNCTATHI